MSGTRYYHGGPPDLQGWILPPVVTGAKCSSDYGADDVHRRDLVYLCSDVNGAAIWAALHPSRKGWIYEVEPDGAVEPDPDCSQPGLSFACRRARIVTGTLLDPAFAQRVREEFLGPLA